MGAIGDRVTFNAHIIGTGTESYRLRTIKTNATPLLLHINMEAGHGGASGRYDYLKEIAFDYAFLLTQLGVVATP